MTTVYGKTVRSQFKTTRTLMIVSTFSEIPPTSPLQYSFPRSRRVGRGGIPIFKCDFLPFTISKGYNTGKILHMSAKREIPTAKTTARKVKKR
ncbi:hypothetical protein JG688_00009806 [Phytophthora aleatoria]|uniref:Uncharacterized protein n=1 Tax=Phytophthora aleatoria TaxID=2496075 RepID=A0A8J5IR15_9STRA|nr:hypothetical protein JG688_00009806 [Phytophthora aleatoria]